MLQYYSVRQRGSLRMNLNQKKILFSVFLATSVPCHHRTGLVLYICMYVLSHHHHHNIPPAGLHNKVGPYDCCCEWLLPGISVEARLWRIIFADHGSILAILVILVLLGVVIGQIGRFHDQRSERPVVKSRMVMPSRHRRRRRCRSSSSNTTTTSSWSCHKCCRSRVKKHCGRLR